MNRRDNWAAEAELTRLFGEVIGILDPNPMRDGLDETPARAAAAFMTYTCGYEVDTKALLKAFEGGNGQTTVSVKDIPFYSMCEHHLAPFFGKATITYRPAGDRVVGLSKLARLLEAHSRRLQVQERIGYAVAKDIMDVLRPRWVSVTLEATHMCMCSRGARAHGATTQTETYLYGEDN